MKNYSHSRATRWLVLSVFLFLTSFSVAKAAPAHVVLDDNGYSVDGVRVPYWYGAEVQYFRARGGAKRNVPKAEVVALWTKLMDRLVEARMNAVSLYVPWDFHEPIEGTFDFAGALDQDKDGLPDYPSRDLNLFLDMLNERGIKQVMIRPGPYINAEWGPTGFGAVPLWFITNYPQALAVSQSPDRPKTVTWAHPDFRERVVKFFAALQKQVLHNRIGPGKSVVFFQIDNETNYFWDSIYQRDLSKLGLERFRSFVANRYSNSLPEVQKAYENADIKSFETIAIPKNRQDKVYAGQAWHYDWFLFHDDEIRDYYRFLRSSWEKLGVTEPDVIFTSCDSFNAFESGLLPRLDYRQKDKLTLTTMNIYPKTTGTLATSTLNEPMKAAHDATLVANSHRAFYGTSANWVMSSETVGGWFPKWAEVSLNTRQHTYGALLGAKVKAMTIYYFHEGYDWDGLEKNDLVLNFDAPLDKDMNSRPAFKLLTELGKTLETSLGKGLADATPVTASVLIAHDSSAQYPVAEPDALRIASNESASLFGIFREAGAFPEVGFLEGYTDAELATFKLVVWHDPGYDVPRVNEKLHKFLNAGGTLMLIGRRGELVPGVGNILYFKDSPAKDWNTDDYPRLKNALQALGQIRTILEQVSIKPSFTVSTRDGEPFVHVWEVRNEKAGKRYLFVENFARKQRQIEIPITGSFLGSKKLELARLWGGDADLKNAATWTYDQPTLTLDVSADGIDVWEMTEPEPSVKP